MKMTTSSTPTNNIFLGTSGWGQKVDKSEAYRIVELFYDNKYRWVDTSTNYPIDGKPENYGQTVLWLSEFCRDFPELKIYCKVGSASNLGDSTQLINPSYLALIFDLLYDKFNVCLGGMGIHWDAEVMESDRTDVIYHFQDLHEKGYAIGLSGIQQLQNYNSSAIGKNLPWVLQTNVSPVKASQVTEDIELSRKSFPKGKIYGYNVLGGINAKGIPKRFDRLTFLSKILRGNQISGTDSDMNYVLDYINALNIDGIVVGPTTVGQCQNWVSIIDRLHHE